MSWLGTLRRGDGLTTMVALVEGGGRFAHVYDTSVV